MRWIHHSATAFCVTLLATANPVISTLAAATTAMPDKIEFFIPVLRHRGISHDPALWFPVLLGMAVLAVSPLYDSFSIPAIADILRLLTVGMTIGVCIHLFLDGLSKSGIPVCRKYRFAAGWYKTFTLSEHLLSLGICASCLAIAALLGRLTPDVNSLMGYFTM